MAGESDLTSAGMSGYLTVLLKASVEVTRLLLDTVRNVLIVSALAAISLRLNLPWLFQFATLLWLAILVFFMAQATLLFEKLLEFLTSEKSAPLNLPVSFEKLWWLRLVVFVTIGFFTAKFVNYRLADVLQSFINSELLR